MADGHIEPAGPDGQHAHATAGRRVAVRAQQRRARHGKALQVHLMADAIARPRVIEAVFRGHVLEIDVVVGVAKIPLQHVVIDVAYG